MPSDILIQPNRGSTTLNPIIFFSGSAANNSIRLETLPSGSVAFLGKSGSLFSIVDSMSGSLMAVSDVSGLPILEVFSDDRVVMGKFNSNTLVVTGSRVSIGKATPNATLDVNGNTIITGSINSKNARTATYTSVTGASGNWFPLFFLSDADSGVVTCLLKTYAHSSLLFTASKPWSGATSHAITILNCQVNANGGYPNVTGVRIRQSGWVEIQLTWSSGPTVDITAQAIGSGDSPTFVASLATTTESDTIIDTVSTLISGGVRAQTLIASSKINFVDSDNVSLSRQGTFSTYTSGNSLLNSTYALRLKGTNDHAGYNVLTQTPYNIDYVSGDNAMPYGYSISDTRSGEHSGFLMIPQLAGGGNCDMVFYVGNDGANKFRWKMFSWDGSNNHLSTDKMSLDMSGNLTTAASVTCTDITINKSNGTSSIIFPAGFNDAGFIRHEEATNNTGIMRFSVSDDDGTNDYFSFGNVSSGFVDRFKIAADGTLYMNKDKWHQSLDGRNRFYFANNGTTYFGTYNGYEWRDSANGTLMYHDGSNFSVGRSTNAINAKLDVGGNTVVTGSLTVGTGVAISATAGEIRASNNITAYYSSDERLKTNIIKIDNALEKLTQIDGVLYDWNDTYKKQYGKEDGYFIRKQNSGIIAQQVEKVFPNVVADRQDGYKAVRYELLVPLLIEGIKEQQAQIKNLQNEIFELKNKLK